MKLKNALFNILVYSMLAWSILSAAYVSLPPEYQALIPQFNWLTALISGGATGVVGIAGLTFKAFIGNAKIESDKKYQTLVKEYLELANAYKLVRDEIGSVKLELNATNINLGEMIDLVKIDLQAKLSNPLIDQKVKELIEGVLK